MMNTRDFSHLCRLCLVKDNVNVPIFENNDEGGKSVYSMICSCLPVKLSEVDNLPKKICSSCIEKLNSFYEFRKISSDSEKQLIQWLQELELEPEKSEQDFDNSPEPKLENVDSTYVKNDNNSNTTGVLSTLLNQPEFQENFTLDHSQDSNGEPSIKKLKSNATSSESDDEDNVQTKLESDSNESDAAADQDQDADCGTDSGQLAADNNQPGPSGLGKSSDETPCRRRYIKNKLWPCRKCKETFVTSTLLRAHRKTHVKNKQDEVDVHTFKYDEKQDIFVCNTCSAEFQEKEEAEKHLITHEVIYHCKFCSSKFKKAYDYSTHMFTHSDDETYPCALCSYKTTRRTCMLIHVNNIHLRKFFYKCNTCGKGFNDVVLFKEHDNEHLGIKPFVCVVCNKSFKFSRYLLSHQINYHQVRIEGKYASNQCPICSRIFGRPASVIKHIQKRHTKREGPREKKHLCDTCGKGFACKEKLKIHYRVHTGEKPYACNYCDKRFTKRDYLIMHERVHSGEKPYSCEYCGKCFNQGAPLRIHLRSHTGERPYVCFICSTGFTSRGGLNTHLKSCSVNFKNS